jgi:hypothetical protein
MRYPRFVLASAWILWLASDASATPIDVRFLGSITIVDFPPSSLRVGDPVVIDLAWNTNAPNTCPPGGHPFGTLPHGFRLTRGRWGAPEVSRVHRIRRGTLWFRAISDRRGVSVRQQDHAAHESIAIVRVLPGAPSRFARWPHRRQSLAHARDPLPAPRAWTRPAVLTPSGRSLAG